MARPVKNYCSYRGPCGNSRWQRPEMVSVYLMQLGDSDVYKIGYTSNTPEERMRVIRFYFPDIRLLDSVKCPFKTEKELHSQFISKRVDNGFKEFFKLSKQDVAEILEIFNRLRNG